MMVRWYMIGEESMRPVHRLPFVLVISSCYIFKASMCISPSHLFSLLEKVIHCWLITILVRSHCFAALHWFSMMTPSRKAACRPALNQNLDTWGLWLIACGSQFAVRGSGHVEEQKVRGPRFGIRFANLSASRSDFLLSILCSHIWFFLSEALLGQFITSKLNFQDYCTTK